MTRSPDLHAWLEKIGWPKSYVGKVFLVCFIATHIPLIAFVAYLVIVQERFDSSVLMILLLILAATMVAMAFAFGCLFSLLQPVGRIAENLQDYALARHIPGIELAPGSSDLVSRVRRDIVVALGHLERRANIDPVTGIYNRLMAEERLREDLSRIGRDESALTLAMIDIDHFKQINDSYGHPFGDDCLRRFAQSVKSCIRESDWLGRYGGDEFLLVLWNNDDNGADCGLRRLRETVYAKRGAIADAAETTFTISMGAVRIQHKMDYQQAIAVVDRELLLAKRAGRDRILVSEPV